MTHRQKYKKLHWLNRKLKECRNVQINHQYLTAYIPNWWRNNGVSHSLSEKDFLDLLQWAWRYETK
jgi:hypothetical protein